MVWNERMEESREFHVIGAVTWNERKQKDILVQGICKLAKYMMIAMYG